MLVPLGVFSILIYTALTIYSCYYSFQKKEMPYAARIKKIRIVTFILFLALTVISQDFDLIPFLAVALLCWLIYAIFQMFKALYLRLKYGKKLGQEKIKSENCLFNCTVGVVLCFLSILIIYQMPKYVPKTNNTTAVTQDTTKPNTQEKATPDVKKEVPEDVQKIEKATGLTQAQSESIAAILKQCGFDSFTIEPETSKDNSEGAGEKWYMLSYNDIEKIPLEINSDGTVRKISLPGFDLYANNQVNYTIKQFDMSSDERNEIIIATEDAVKANLVNPDSADFQFEPTWDVIKTPNGYVATAYVENQNAFGANVRNTFLASFSPDKKLKELTFQ